MSDERKLCWFAGFAFVALCAAWAAWCVHGFPLWALLGFVPATAFWAFGVGVGVGGHVATRHLRRRPDTRGG
jgi:hypothetical protein